MFYEDGRVREITSSTMRTRLRNTVAVIGKEVLGFTKDDIGLHSIRSGGAMVMFLSGVSDIIIQRVGRWESTAFMEYIREQVETFTYGVSTKMLKCESFYHLNKFEENKTNYEEFSPNLSTKELACEEDGNDLCIPYSIRYSKSLFSEFEEL